VKLERESLIDQTATTGDNHFGVFSPKEVFNERLQCGDYDDDVKVRLRKSLDSQKEERRKEAENDIDEDQEAKN